MSTIHDQRYIKLITELREVRKGKNITQEQLAVKLNKSQSYIAKIEKLERRLDVIELIDWLNAIGEGLEQFIKSIGFLKGK
ncbi:helix-turn-helix domain-containing protein [Chloroflexota bacterium]